MEKQQLISVISVALAVIAMVFFLVGLASAARSYPGWYSWNVPHEERFGEIKFFFGMDVCSKDECPDTGVRKPDRYLEGSPPRVLGDMLLKDGDRIFRAGKVATAFSTLGFVAALVLVVLSVVITLAAYGNRMEVTASFESVIPLMALVLGIMCLIFSIIAWATYVALWAQFLSNVDAKSSPGHLGVGWVLTLIAGMFAFSDGLLVFFTSRK